MDMTFEVTATSNGGAGIAQAQIPAALDSAYSEAEIEYDWASAKVLPKEVKKGEPRKGRRRTGSHTTNLDGPNKTRAGFTHGPNS